MNRTAPATLEKTRKVRYRRAVVMHFLVAALLFSIAAALAQAPSGGYRIAGKVLNADSGAPLSGAEVAIVSVVDGTWGGPNGTVQTIPRRGRGGRGNRRGPVQNALQGITTGDDGSFSFEHVPAGKYSLEGSHRGFITASYQEHGMYSTAIVTGAGIPSENLELRLSPGSVIGGSVIDAAGDPLEQGQVSLYRLSDDGLGTIRMYRSANTDDLGAYEFAHLTPGTYFVSAAGSVWYAQSSRENAASLPGPTTNLDLAYPRSFYADATDSSAATPIPVRGGEHLRIDLHMQAVPAVHLTYTMPAPNGSADTRFRAFPRPPMVGQSIFGTGESSYTSGFMQTRSSENGQQTLSISVAPGTYEVEVAGHSLSVNATGDTVLDPQTGTPPVEISGRLAAVAGATLPETVDISLEPADAHGGSAVSTVAHEGSFHFDGVRPGAYEITAQSGGSPITIVDMAASGAQVEGHVLRVSTQPISLAATVTTASVIVSGFARAAASASGQQDEAGQQGEGASGVMIVLVPQHAGDHALYRRDQSDSDGSFSLRQVAAGTYTLVAIRDGWDLDWARPEVIAHYLPGGQPVAISSSSNAAVHLAKPVIVQER